MSKILKKKNKPFFTTGRNMESSSSQPAAPMDPTLMKAFVRGREAGLREGKQEGKIAGMAEMMTMFSEWTEVIDEEVKGIGPHTKMNIQIFLADKIKEAIEKNKLGHMTVIKDSIKRD